MSKPIIAVDVDDVLAAEAEFVVEYSNKHWGHTLTLDEYHEHWEEMWGVDLSEAERRAAILHAAGIVSSYRLLEQGREVLEILAKKYLLYIVTSRRATVADETRTWVEENFGDLFEKVHFTGFYDGNDANRHLKSKGDVLKELEVSYLIDDQPKHCFGAAKHGIHALLFGDYGISRHLELPEGVTRVKDWLAVKEYFEHEV